MENFALSGFRTGTTRLAGQGLTYCTNRSVHMAKWLGQLTLHHEVTVSSPDGGKTFQT